MQSRPVYYGLICIQSNFDWLMGFAVRKNTAGCESAETYFQALKDVFSVYNIWSKKKALALMAGIQCNLHQNMQVLMHMD